MSFNLQEGSYIYHGNAFGVSARFDHPEKAPMPTQAQAVLAPTGGEAVSSVRDYNFRDRVMFDEAIAHVAGSRDPDGSYHTDVSATVRNLRFLQVHADFINMRITSVHQARDKRRGTIEEGEVSFPGSRINGLVIAGHAIGIRWDETLSMYPTFEGLRKAHPKRGYLHACGGVKDAILYDTIVESIEGCQPLTKTEAKKLLSDPKASLTGLRYQRNVVFVPEFGKVFIGEVLVERGVRRLTMLRIELGCGTGGGGSAGGGTGNGGEIPPDTLYFG